MIWKQLKGKFEIKYNTSWAFLLSYGKLCFNTFRNLISWLCPTIERIGRINGSNVLCKVPLELWSHKRLSVTFSKYDMKLYSSYTACMQLPEVVQIVIVQFQPLCTTLPWEQDGKLVLCFFHYNVFIRHTWGIDFHKEYTKCWLVQVIIWTAKTSYLCISYFQINS